MYFYLVNNNIYTFLVNLFNSNLEKLQYNQCIKISNSVTILCSGNIRILIIIGGASDANGDIVNVLQYGTPLTKSVGTCQYSASASFGRIFVNTEGVASVQSVSGVNVGNTQYISGTVVYAVDNELV